ncbi:MAG: hypothetical protein KGK03_04190 [Candidatus Omnitrophica bacterium]|nr:hypothetical protein [Candidatus Omnitrophota bacterium]MDE2222253.1 hypothetical protein [Candidatus Omnitrophota bacterium]
MDIKRTLMAVLMAAAVSCPVWADVNSQKSAVQHKYQNLISAENQRYNNEVSKTKQKYQNDPTKLDNTLKELEIRHTKKIDNLTNDENLQLQKINEKAM